MNGVYGTGTAAPAVRLALALIIVAVLATIFLSIKILNDARTSDRQSVVNDISVYAAIVAVGDYPFLRKRIEEARSSHDVSRIIYGDVGGRFPIATIETWPRQLSELEPGSEAELVIGDDRFYVRSADFSAHTERNIQDVRLVIGHRLPGPAERAAWSASIIVWSILAAALTFGIFFQRWHLRTYLLRLQTINRSLRRVSEGDFDTRIDLHSAPDDLTELVAHINDMLGRISGLIVGMQTLTETAAHELRTPLTRMRLALSEIERLNVEDQTRTLIGDLRYDVEDLLKLFDMLFVLSRSSMSANSSVDFSVLDLSCIVQDCFDSYRDVFDENGRHLSMRAEGALPFLGERSLLLRMLGNLLENSLKYSPVGSSTTISCWRDHNRWIACVSNTGSAFPDDIRQSAFKTKTRSTHVVHLPGLGLGLNIVRAIAAKHGARAWIEDREDCAEICIEGNLLASDA